MKKATWHFHNVYVQSTGTAVGPKEGKGPLSSYFDHINDDLYGGEMTWELAERQLLHEAISKALHKGNFKKEQIDYFIAGDLLNQLVTTNYKAKSLSIPLLGVFSACATTMEGLALAALLIDTKKANYVLTAAASHYATAERQFRYPTEFAYQRPYSAQHTVTGAGAVVVGNVPTAIQVKEATIGKVIDIGIDHPFHLGAAMAPAAVDTLHTHLKETNRHYTDYDLIVTGDLARIGSAIFRRLLQDDDIWLTTSYEDCGVMIYDQEQDVFAGGSGAGCPAVVTYGYLLKKMTTGDLQNMLVIATGALFNAQMIYQKQSIPCIAHAVSFERVEV